MTVGIPMFMTRKLYRRGSLRETADGRYTFCLQNPLATATIVAPPVFTINGIRHQAKDVESKIPLANLSKDNPLKFAKGDEFEVSFSGRLLRGANRIHLTVVTKEFGDIEMFVEDKEADYCELPRSFEEE